MWPSRYVFFVMLCLLLGLSSCKESAKQARTAPEDHAKGAEGKDGGQTIAEDTSAGKVIDLVGTVVATRGDEEERTLTLWAPIYAEDQVHTSSDGSVAILLRRNGAIHDIGSDQTVAIQGSLAWNAARHEAGEFDLASEYAGMGTAGANGEKSAGDTSATTPDTRPSDTTEAVNNDPASPAGDLQDDEGPKENAKDKPAPITRDDDDARSVRQGPSPLRYGDGGFALDLSKPTWPARSQTGTRVTGGLALSGETPDKPGKRTNTPSPKQNEKKANDESGPSPKQEPQEATVLKLKNEVQNEQQAASTPPSKRSFILAVAKACQEKHKGQGSFSVQITFSQSKVTAVKTDGPSELAKTLSCLEEALKKSTAGPAEGSLIFTLKL